MADNPTLPATGAVVAADDISGVLYPRVKISIGADGSATDASSTNPIPVTQTATSLTPLPPNAHIVTGTSGMLLAANPNRKGLILVNISGDTISLSLVAVSAAILYAGITIGPDVSWTMTERTFTTGQINAISSGTSSNVAIQEFQ